jgi:hypothetical protein
MLVEFYFDNVQILIYETKQTRLWCNIVFQTDVEHIERNGGFTLIYIH